MDILVYAIKMELDGEAYYREQAERNRGNVLGKVFADLADEECSHAKILEDKSRGLRYRLNSRVRNPLKNVFAGLEDFKADAKKYAGQADAYRMAMEKEKESIALYKKLLGESPDCADLYDFLIAQEEEHYALLEEIVKMVNRPDEWVEAAEFGNREPYDV